jgi:WD40 repeat protein
MQIVAKHSGAVSSLAVTRATGRLISSGDDGVINVYGPRGMSIMSRLRNAHGCEHLGLCDGGEKLVYVTRDGWIEYRGSSTGSKYPIKGAQYPRGEYGSKPEYKYLQMFGDFRTERFAVVLQYDWRQSSLTQPQGPERIKPSCVELYRFGRRRRRNTLNRFGNIVNLTAEKLTCACWTESFFAGAWGHTVGIHDGRERFSVGYDAPDGGWFGKFHLGSDVRCMTSAVNNDIVYGGTEDSRIFRLNLMSEALDEPRYWRIPDGPVIECVAISPCGRYLAVGVEYDAYGAILVYSGQEMRPVLMLDSGRSPTHLAWRYDRFEEAPDARDPDEALTLFSGHTNGNVVKWYVARQLRWQGLLEERVRPPASTGRVERVADPTEETLERAIDV